VLTLSYVVLDIKVCMAITTQRLNTIITLHACQYLFANIDIVASL